VATALVTVPDNVRELPVANRGGTADARRGPVTPKNQSAVYFRPSPPADHLMCSVATKPDRFNT
jgi:hypothetical protein